MAQSNTRSSAASLTIAILAGGESTRMGSDKAGVLVDEVPMLERVAAATAEFGCRRLVVGRAANATWKSGLEFIADRWQGAGPLGGLDTALSATETDVLLLGCDMPWLSPEVLEWLVRENRGRPHGVVAKRDRPEPLFAVYPQSARPEVQSRLALGDRSLMGLIRALRMPTAAVPTNLWSTLNDADYPSDLRRHDRG